MTYSTPFPATMNEQHTISLLEQDLHALEMHVEELIRVCTHLKEENQTLRARTRILNNDLDVLRRNNSVACSRVEAMLEKLNLLQADSG